MGLPALGLGQPGRILTASAIYTPFDGSSFGCSNCPTVKVVPHSCKSVFCSSCGKVRTDQWCDELLSDLLEVPYRHLVFTLPWELRLLIQDNRRVLLNVLFRAAADAVLSLSGQGPTPRGRSLRASPGWRPDVQAGATCQA